jgi:hypothetical protein
VAVRVATWGAALLAIAAAASGGVVAAAVLAAAAAGLYWRTRRDQRHAHGAWNSATRRIAEGAAPPAAGERPA